jgi:hypothetical protein
MSDIGGPAESGDSGQSGGSTQPAEPAEPDGPQEPGVVEDARRRATLAAYFSQSRRMDTVDTCRMRLVVLRTRIETNWPQTGSLLFNRGQGLGREATADIAALLVALPTPLPLQAGGEPEPIMRETDTDMREVAGRAVDAGLALLDGTTLETIYHGNVKMLESYHAGAPEPIIVSNLTVGVLVATIIGTLEAISETVMGSSAAGKGAKGKLPADGGVSTQKPGKEPGPRKEAALPHAAPPKRGRIVPRI